MRRIMERNGNLNMNLNSNLKINIILTRHGNPNINLNVNIILRGMAVSTDWGSVNTVVHMCVCTVQSHCTPTLRLRGPHV